MTEKVPGNGPNPESRILADTAMSAACSNGDGLRMSDQVRELDRDPHEAKAIAWAEAAACEIEGWE